MSTPRTHSPHPRIEVQHVDADLLPDEGLLPSRTDAHLGEPVLRAIQEAVQDCSVTAVRVVAGHVYERRNGEQTLSPFGGEHPDPGRILSHEDVYLQIGIRVPAHHAGPVTKAIDAVETLMTEQKLREIESELAVAHGKTVAAQAEEAKIQARIDRMKGVRS